MNRTINPKLKQKAIDILNYYSIAFEIVVENNIEFIKILEINKLTRLVLRKFNPLTVIDGEIWY